MTSYIQFRKKEKKLMTGLLLALTSLGVSAYADNTVNPKAVKGLQSIVVVAPKHTGEEGAPFYANNIQLEPLNVYFCFGTTPPASISMDKLSFYTMQGGSGEGSKHAVTLDTNTANDQGFYLYDKTSDYYKMYTQMGFSTAGGVYVGQKPQLMSAYADDDDDGGDTSACGGKNFIEKTLYLRAKKVPGVFNFMISVPNDQGDTISSDASANNYITMPPLQYTKNDFKFFKKDFKKQNELEHKRHKTSKGGAEDQYKYQQNGNSDYIFHFDPKKPNGWQQVRYNAPGFRPDQRVFYTRSAIDGSAFDKMTLNLYGGNGSHTKALGLHTWWGMLTGMQTNGLYAPPLVSVAPLNQSVDAKGHAGNLFCPTHSGTNHWAVQFLWNASKTLEQQEDGGDYKTGVYKYETLTGGIGLPSDVGDPAVFWMQSIINHWDNGSQHHYGCGSHDHVTLIGYDSYGNEFQMKMLPYIGDSGASIAYVQTVNPYDHYRPTP